MARIDPKDRLLDTAEQMFAEHGYAATSLRQLTSAAGLNLAAVNYHFGSKEELAKAVLARRIAPINRERLRRLDAIAGTPTVQAIVRAFVEPPMCSTSAGSTSAAGDIAGRRLCRVFGRISVEQPPFLRTFLAGQFRKVGGRFEAVLATAMPGLDAAAIWWRLHFVIGAMAHTLQNSETLAELSGNRCDPNDLDGLVERLVEFAVGGLCAPRRGIGTTGNPAAGTRTSRRARDKARTA